MTAINATEIKTKEVVVKKINKWLTMVRLTIIKYWSDTHSVSEIKIKFQSFDSSNVNIYLILNCSVLIWTKKTFMPFLNFLGHVI